MRTRIAPTPSGFLHVGNGAAFVLAWKLAREAGGKLLLRIDDLDAERVRPEHVGDIFDTLHWLGVDWDEGPRDAEDLHRHWSQHARLAHYRDLLGQLREGGHLYACDCSRKMIAQRGGTLEYDGHCRRRGLDLEQPDVAWRLRLRPGVLLDMRTWPDGKPQRLPLSAPDPVLRQRNGRPAYQAASLADDLQFRVDTIVRGMDLLPSTLVQLYIAQALGRTAFSAVRFLHHPLLRDAEGGKLSKSKGAGSLRSMREAGLDARAVHARAAQLLEQAG